MSIDMCQDARSYQIKMLDQQIETLKNEKSNACYKIKDAESNIVHMKKWIDNIKKTKKIMKHVE